MHGNKVKVAIPIPIVQTVNRLVTRNNGLGQSVRTLHGGAISPIGVLYCHQLVNTTEYRAVSRSNQVFTNAKGIDSSLLFIHQTADRGFVKTVRHYNFDIGLASVIKDFTKTLRARTKVARIDANTLYTAIRVIRVLFDQVIIKLNRVQSTAFKNVVGVNEQRNIVRVNISKSFKGFPLSGEKLYPGMRNSTHGRYRRAKHHFG